PVGRRSLSGTELRAPGPSRPCASLELVLEGDPEDLGGVVLPVLAEEDGAAAVRCERRGESAGLPVGIDEALVRIEELRRPILRERVVERRIEPGHLVLEPRPSPSAAVRLLAVF